MNKYLLLSVLYMANVCRKIRFKWLLSPILLCSTLFLLNQNTAFGLACSANNQPFQEIENKDNTMDIESPYQYSSATNQIIFDLTSIMKCKCTTKNSGHSANVLYPGPGGLLSVGLSKLQGGIIWKDATYLFPVGNHSTNGIVLYCYHPPGTIVSVPVKLYISGGIGSVDFRQGDLIATIKMVTYERTAGGHHLDRKNMDLNVYTTQDMNAGGCTVDNQNINVSLPDHELSVLPQSITNIPLTVYCARPTSLSYSIDGNVLQPITEGVFANDAKNGATGMAVQILNANRMPVAARRPHSLGIVGTTRQDLGLKAKYYPTGGPNGDPFHPGKVESTVYLTFIIN